MEITKDEMMSILDKLTFQEKQKGYLSILVHFLLDSRKGIFHEDEIKDYWDTLHNIPYFWAEDLKCFDDKWLWDEIFYNVPSVDYVIECFLRGLPIEKSSPRYKIIQDIHDRWDAEEAEWRRRRGIE